MNIISKVFNFLYKIVEYRWSNDDAIVHYLDFGKLHRNVKKYTKKNYKEKLIIVARRFLAWLQSIMHFNRKYRFFKNYQKLP